MRDRCPGLSRRAVRVLRSTISALLALSLLIALPASSLAEPTPAQRLTEKRQEAEGVQAVLDDMDAQLEGVVEAFNKAQYDLDQTDREIVRNQLELEKATRELEKAQAILNRRVTEIYRSPQLSMVDVMLGTNDFADFLARLDYLARIGNQDAAIKLRVLKVKSRVEQIRDQLSRQRAAQVQLRAELRNSQADIENRIAAKERYLAGLNDEIQKLLEEERERQRKLAEARARAALGAAKPSWYPQPDTIYPRDKVVDICLAQLGTPYQWGAVGPDKFDCSGLMLYVYAHVGVYLPRVSQDQSRYGVAVQRSELQPGDLVFFGYGADPNRVHHVGMYLGGGRYIHAPKRNDVVKISLLSDRSDYTGATRP